MRDKGTIGGLPYGSFFAPESDYRDYEGEISDVLVVWVGVGERV